MSHCLEGVAGTRMEYEKSVQLILNWSTGAEKSSGSLQLAGASGKGMLYENGSRVTKLKAPGSVVEWLGRKGGTNRGQNRDQACGYSQFLVSLQSKSLLSVIDKGLRTCAMQVW